MQSLKNNQILLDIDPDVPPVQIKWAVNDATYFLNYITLQEEDVPPLLKRIHSQSFQLY